MSYDTHCSSCGRPYADFGPEGVKPCECHKMAAQAVRDDMLTGKRAVASTPFGYLYSTNGPAGAINYFSLVRCNEYMRNDPWKETPLYHASLSASPVVEPKPVTDLVDDLAKWLHDETAHPESYPDHTWPETDRDDGRRSGGWVKIVPLHAQEYFRDIARRLDARYRSRYVAPVAQEPVAVNKLVNAILNELFRASDNAVIAHNTVYELKPYIERAILSTLPRASLTK